MNRNILVAAMRAAGATIATTLVLCAAARADTHFSQYAFEVAILPVVGGIPIFRMRHSLTQSRHWQQRQSGTPTDEITPCDIQFQSLSSQLK